MKKNSVTTIPKKLIPQLKPFMNLTNMPEDVSISTITVTCHLDITFNVANIGRYAQLHPNAIRYTKYGKKSKYIRSLGEITEDNEKSEKEPFYNQVTVKVRTSQKDKEKPVNIKIFDNGSLQLTGCVGLQNFIESLTVLFHELKRTKVVYDRKTRKIIEMPFVSDKLKLNLSEVKKVKICMINSNFKVGFKIDRLKLYKLLLSKDIRCQFEPCVHACVNIKHVYKKDEISVFVFSKGSIIITGARIYQHIISAYIFIVKILYENFHEIVRLDVNTLLQRPEVIELFE